MHDRYALFVWPAYAVTALAFAWMVADTLIRARAWRRRAQQLEAAKSAPQPAPPPVSGP
jgi:heme exporter protein D